MSLAIGEMYFILNEYSSWNQDKLPHLAKLARRLYSIPATLACVERQFSAGSLLINERRAALNHDTVEDVLFIRSIKRALRSNPGLFST